MAYCWAALRTLAILIGVFVGLLVLAAIASGIGHAFLYTFEAGCLALALACGVLALFGHQLVRVSTTPRTRRIGGLTRNCGGAITLLTLASFAVDYGYTAVKESRQVAVHGPWEQYATKKPNPFDQFDSPAQGGEAVAPSGRGNSPGMFDDLIPKLAAARSNETTPTCDDALVAGYKTSRAEAAAVPPPPPGFVLDRPPSRTRVGGVVTTRPCLAPVHGDPYAAISTRAARVFTLDDGWEIRAPGDTRDEEVLRVFDALPANAVLPVKSR
jgi:hypothetical protein